MKLIFSRVFERRELIDARVVNQNVETAEGFFRFCKKVFDVVLLRDVRLDGDRLSAFFCYFVDHLVRRFLGRRIVNHYRSAFDGKILGDTGADSLRRTRHNRNFPSKLFISHCILPLFFCSSLRWGTLASLSPHGVV